MLSTEPTPSSPTRAGTRPDIIDELSRLAALSTSAVSDALDKLGIAGQAVGIAPLDRSFRLVGRAWTLRYGPVGQDRGTVGDFIDDLGPDDVVVLDNQGRLDATVWGDLLTTTAHRRGVAGTVIDGVCRDIDRSLHLGYPVFSRGNWMRTGKDRVRVEATQTPVSIGGVRVEPGDLLLGDGDGLVVLPALRAEHILAAAEEIERAEQAIREAVDAGSSLRDARARHRYHDLQHGAGS
jgi:regulator of RNase E activity RraA